MVPAHNSGGSQWHSGHSDSTTLSCRVPLGELEVGRSRRVVDVQELSPRPAMARTGRILARYTIAGCSLYQHYFSKYLSFSVESVRTSGPRQNSMKYATSKKGKVGTSQTQQKTEKAAVVNCYPCMLTHKSCTSLQQASKYVVVVCHYTETKKRTTAIANRPIRIKPLEGKRQPQRFQP